MTGLLLAGCRSTDGPEAIRLDGPEYPRAFTACIEAGREAQMPPALADRSGGIIETEPRSMGSMLEPWRGDASGPEQGLESTLQFQRRRARFVFVPEGFEPEAIDGRTAFDGGARPGSPTDMSRFNLERHPGRIELRCVVTVERGFVPGNRPSTWSSTLATRSSDPAPAKRGDGTDRQQTLWTPVGRDEAAERALLARVQALLNVSSPSGNDAVTSGRPASAPSS